MVNLIKSMYRSLTSVNFDNCFGNMPNKTTEKMIDTID